VELQYVMLYCSSQEEGDRSKSMLTPNPSGHQPLVCEADQGRTKGTESGGKEISSFPNGSKTVPSCGVGLIYIAIA
jgi:hypothetical protein